MRTELTDTDIRELLLAVGLDPATGPDAYRSSFAELDLDSLARVEIATRLQTRYGFDVEEQITAESTPLDVKDLVNTRLSAANR
jgi:hypothetical protein